MNAVLRHMALRLWATAVLGGLVCLALLPLWPSTPGSKWGVAAAAVVLCGSYGLVGWAMNRWGLAGLQRMIQEAAVWERAGKTEKAHGAFLRAVAYFDSFWLSPFFRQRGEEMITGRLTRFYLSLSSPGRHGREIVRTYLARHPEDAAVAQTWLEKLLARRSRDPLDHELAALIACTLDDNDRISQLLVQLYLCAERTDFEALRTYRQLWENQRRLPADLVRSLAHLLLSEATLSDWALQVYLKGYELGDSRCLTGISECLRHLTQHPGNRRDWLAAETVVASADPALVHRWDGPLKTTDRPGKPTVVVNHRAPSRWKSAGRSADRALSRLTNTLCAWFAQIGRGANAALAAVRRSLRPRHVLAVIGVAVIVAVVTITANRPVKSPPPVSAPQIVAEQPVPAAPKPFTIQVAAYLKPEDAQRFVDQLKKQGLEAFATMATSSNRTWHQVKVSHFATRRQAQEYGEQLKSRGVIDDFYVANFEP